MGLLRCTYLPNPLEGTDPGPLSELHPQYFLFFLRQGLTKLLGAQAGLELWILLASPSRVLELQVCATTPGKDVPILSQGVSVF